MHMEPIILNLKLAYARLTWPTHPSKTTKKAIILIAQHHSLCVNNLSITRILSDFVLISHKLMVWD